MNLYVKVSDKPDWIKAPNPFDNFNMAYNKMIEGTGTWLLEDEVFNDWKQNGQVLWLKGKGMAVLSANHLIFMKISSAGSGKTFLR